MTDIRYFSVISVIWIRTQLLIRTGIWLANPTLPCKESKREKFQENLEKDLFRAGESLYSIITCVHP